MDGFLQLKRTLVGQRSREIMIKYGWQAHRSHAKPLTGFPGRSGVIRSRSVLRLAHARWFGLALAVDHAETKATITVLSFCHAWLLDDWLVT